MPRRRLPTKDQATGRELALALAVVRSQGPQAVRDAMRRLRLLADGAPDRQTRALAASMVAELEPNRNRGKAMERAPEYRNRRVKAKA